MDVAESSAIMERLIALCGAVIAFIWAIFANR